MQKEEATRQHVYYLLGVFYLNRRVLFNFVRENNVYCIEQKLSTGFPSCMLFSDGSERGPEKLGLGFERSESR